MAVSARTWPSLALLAATACGGGSTTSTEPAAGERVVAGVVAGEALALRAVAAEPADVLGVGAGGQLLAARGAAVVALEGDAPGERRPYEARLGDVQAIVPGAEVGAPAWVLAGGELWALSGWYLVRQELPAELGQPAAVRVVPRGPLAGTWIGSSRGLHRWTPPRALEQLVVAGAPAATVRAIACDGAGESLLVLFGDALFLLRADGAAITSQRVEAAGVADLAGSDGAVFAATDRGLLRFADGAWTRFTLAPDGAAPLALAGLSAAKDGVLWARTAGGDLAVEEGDSFVLHPAPEVLQAIAAGPEGALFASTRTAVVELRRTVPQVSFAADVLPWVRARCAGCHANQTASFEDPAVFAEKAEAALARVRSGDMPRCAGGLLCPSGQRLPPSDYLVLERWIRAGKPR